MHDVVSVENVGPEAFLEPKKKQPLKVLVGGDESRVGVPTPGPPEMRVVDPLETAFLLVKHSNLSTLKVYPKLGDAYLYDESRGYFVKFDKKELMVIMSGILSQVKLLSLQDSRYLRKVLANLFTLPQCTVLGTPEFDSHVKVFKNGVLNLETKEFEGWSPKFFVNHGLSFNYDSKARCEKFERLRPERSAAEGRNLYDGSVRRKKFF